MSGISLTASMRSNLLSLQNIASQQDIVQNRLATGLKVSSAIDNPSSYYTASSLNNRAADLTALLDAMSQGIQTIKAASEAIDAGTKFLEQAKAVVNQANEAAYSDCPNINIEDLIRKQQAERATHATAAAPDRTWLLANGADFVVENKAELYDALANATAGQKIVINAAIDIEINDASQQLIVNDGVELLGATVLHSGAINADGSYKGQLNITNNTGEPALFFYGNNRLSDLSVNIKASEYTYAIKLTNGNNHVHNLDLRTSHGHVALSFENGSKNFLDGNVNIINKGQDNARGIETRNSVLDITGNINIFTSAPKGHGIYSTAAATTNILDNTAINIHTTNEGAYGLDNDKISFLNIGAAQINVVSEKAGAFYNEAWDSTTGGNTIKIKSGADIKVSARYLFRNNKSETTNPQTGEKCNWFDIEAGVKVFFHDLSNNSRGNWETKSLWSQKATTTTEYYDNNYFLTSSGWQNNGSAFYGENNSYLRQYITILTQYDMLISDASYKGINLLEGQYLKINFNEDRSSKIDVPGVKADSESLGLKTKEWQTAEDVEKSVSELEEAINSLRSFASEFGNYYSIVTTRQDFTENLINVLEEGADKLTLADMNQESANMLALQTAQQLAVNSLSLASQASQSILRLF